MADSKVSALTEITLPIAPSDSLYIIDDMLGTPTSKRVSVKNFVGNIPANTSITGDLSATGNTSLNNLSVSNAASTISVVGSLTVTSNNFVLQSSLTPANSSVSMTTGKFFWDDDYLYVKTSTGIKRVALSSF